MLIKEYYLIENNQEVKINRDDIKKGQLIRIVAHNGKGVCFSNEKIITLTNSYRDKTITPFGTITKGWVVQSKIPPNSQIWTINL